MPVVTPAGASTTLLHSGSAGLKHDIANLSTGIVAAMELMARGKMDPLEASSVVLRRMLALTDLVTRMPDGPARAAIRARFDVNKSVIKVEGDFVLFPRAVTFSSRYEPTSLRVSGDHTEFERALVNIIENGCSAVTQADDPQIRLTAQAGTDFIEVSIQDNGHGMDEETRTRIFEAGFTTKTQRPNHGLGLSITAKIVADLGGTIACESTPGNGSTFRIRLPAS